MRKVQLLVALFSRAFALATLRAMFEASTFRMRLHLMYMYNIQNQLLGSVSLATMFPYFLATKYSILYVLTVHEETPAADHRWTEARYNHFEAQAQTRVVRVVLKDDFKNNYFVRNLVFTNLIADRSNGLPTSSDGRPDPWPKRREDCMFRGRCGGVETVFRIHGRICMPRGFKHRGNSVS